MPYKSHLQSFIAMMLPEATRSPNSPQISTNWVVCIIAATGILGGSWADHAH